MQEVSGLMTEEDLDYCAKQFGLDVNMVRGMRDKDWMQFFDCTKEDLPFFLIDESRWDDVEYEIDALFLADEMDDFFSDPDAPTDEELDLWDSTFARTWASNTSLATGVVPMTKSRQAKTKAAPKKISHYYVIVR